MKRLVLYCGDSALSMPATVCQLWVQDIFAEDKINTVKIDILKNCLLGSCICVYFVGGVCAQLRPCRAFAECYCRGDVDPDLEYILRGGMFWF